MSEWEKQVDKIRCQVNDLQQSLDQTASLTAEQKQILLSGTAQIRDLVSVPEDTKGLLSGVPKLLNSLFKNNTLGAAVIGQDGEWLLFNSLVRAVFGPALHGNVLKVGAEGVQFFSTEGVPLSLEQLPWRRALAGEHIEDQELIVRSGFQKGDVWLQVSSTPMSDNDGTARAAVVLLVDRTEMVNVSRRIRELEAQMARQLELVKSAEDALSKLTSKLGIAGATQAPPAGKQPVEKGAVEGAKILVVDDIPVNQRLLTLQIKKTGFKADTANNGREAAEKAAATQYDLIFMDCDMPVMDGYEATRTIRKAEEGTGRYTPIVAMTSLDRESDRDKCLAAGMDGYLTKGVDEAAFQEVINKYVRKTGAVVPGTVAQEKVPAGGGQAFSLDALSGAFDKQELQDIVTLFMGSSSTLVSCLDFAIDDKDVKAVHHFAYSLKGPAATMCMHAISRLCADITSLAERGDWDSARRRHSTLRSELATVQGKLQEYTKEGFVTSYYDRA